jgi:hypothetical protein
MVDRTAGARAPVIRANLLPRSKENLAFWGLKIDLDYLLQGLAGLAIAAAVGSIGFGIESLRIHRLAEAVAQENAALSARVEQRAEAKRLALDVARYQALARAAEGFRRSGADAAIAVARIGNAVPARVWLNALDRRSNGYQLDGASISVEDLGAALYALGRALPRAGADLVSIDRRDDGQAAVEFSARVDDTAAPTLTRAPFAR